MTTHTAETASSGGDRHRGNLERFARELVMKPTSAGTEQEEQCTK